MISGVFTELRLLSSKSLDTRSLLCVVFADELVGGSMTPV